MRKMRGYSLIELLIVLLIFGIVIIMTIPNIGYFKTIRENNELKEFKRDVLFARNKAITDSRIYKLEFYYHKNAYKIESSESLEYKKTKYFEHGIILDEKNNIEMIQFNSNGTVSYAGKIRFRNRKGEEYNLVITPVRGSVDIRKIN